MRDYMPGPHRAFLQHVESIANIRTYAEATPVSQVTEAFNLAIDELKNLRDIHIGIVTRYITIPAKQQSARNTDLNLAVASSKSSDEKELYGTGGTQLLPFLKQSRDETRDTLIV